MKLIAAVILALVAVAAALPVKEAKDSETLRSRYEQTPEGGFGYEFETDLGLSAQAEGQVKTVTDEENKPRDVLVFRGQYSYIGEDGKPVIITYVADETGFHPEGDSIPKPVRR